MSDQNTQIQQWNLFARVLLKTVLGASLFLSGFVLLLDPYDSLSFSLPLDRAPITTNQRFSYPTIARNLAYDSLVIGTSTSRMLEPALLNQAVGGRFANLAMNSGTPFEQSEILKLFLSHRLDAGEETRTVIVGLDHVWCRRAPYPQFTERPFPPWLYDASPWNDALHMLNFTTIEQAGRLAAFLLGLRDANYGDDGYENFLPPDADYDLAKVRLSLYGAAGRRNPPEAPAFNRDTAPAGWLDRWSVSDFPDLALLDAALQQGSTDVQVIILNPPQHWTQHHMENAERGEERAACKALAHNLVADQGKPVFSIDFESYSEFTLRDENFWDPHHMSKPTAERVIETLGPAFQTKSPPQNGVHVIF